MINKDLIKISVDEIYSILTKKNCPTNKTMIKSIDDTWSSDFLDMNDYGIKNNKGYRCVLVVVDNFSKFGWTIPLKNKYAQSITDAFSQIIKSLKNQDVNQISSKPLMVKNMLIKFSVNF